MERRELLFFGGADLRERGAGRSFISSISPGPLPSSSDRSRGGASGACGGGTGFRVTGGGAITGFATGAGAFGAAAGAAGAADAAGIGAMAAHLGHLIFLPASASLTFRVTWQPGQANLISAMTLSH